MIPQWLTGLKTPVNRLTNPWVYVGGLEFLIDKNPDQKKNPRGGGMEYTCVHIRNIPVYTLKP